jgi:hypothetical protein
MTPVKTPVAPDQEQAFDASAYADPRLRLDPVNGKDVDKIAVRFGGVIELTRSNPDHVEVFRKLVLGKEIDLAELLPLTGRVTNQQNRQRLSADGFVTDLVQTAVVTVTDIGGFGTVVPAEANAEPEGEGDAE